jgi:RNA polymerase sigma-70 factor (ECF subfamily)
MSGVRSREVLRDLNTVFHCGVAGQLSDEELLEQFVTGSDQAAESAFAALVGRHGPMVLGVCRRVLGNRHEAEDAFQATFLVLARKAQAIARREQLASWLHGVARRASLDARARTTRQRANEKRLGVMLPVEPTDDTITHELRAILDEELARLPERHRAAILLCELEGLSRRDAAVRLGVPEGTLSSRLARAKTRLRERLTRRGITLSGATLAAILAHDARAITVPTALADSTIRVATLATAGSSVAGVVSASVITLTEGVLKAMLVAKLKSVILGLATVALVTTGVGVLAQERPSDEDRLKAVERKLDKLLEVLGAATHRQPLPAYSTPPLPTNPAIAASPDRPKRPAPAASEPAAEPTIGVPGGTGAPPQPPGAPALPPPPVHGAPAAPPAPVLALPAQPPVAAWPRILYDPNQYPATIPAPGGTPPGPLHSLGDRIDSLEQRLNNLERRFREFERRLERMNPGRGRGASPPARNLPLGPRTSGNPVRNHELLPNELLDLTARPVEPPGDIPPAGELAPGPGPGSTPLPGRSAQPDDAPRAE